MYITDQKSVDYIPYRGDEIERFRKIYNETEENMLQLFKQQVESNRLGRALYLRCKNPDTKNPCKRLLQNYQNDCELILLTVIPFSFKSEMDNLQSQLKKEYPEWRNALCVHDVWLSIDGQILKKIESTFYDRFEL